MADANLLARGVRGLLLAGSCAALLACAAPTPPTVLVFAEPTAAGPKPGPSAEPPPLQAAEPAALVMLATADRLRSLTPPELAQEIARLSNGNAGAQQQMQLALALLQTRIPADSQRASQVLQRVLAQDSPEARSLHPLARLLSAQLAEQRRVEEGAERQAQLLRDAQRRIEQLNDRLEALRAIERARPSRAAQ